MMAGGFFFMVLLAVVVVALLVWGAASGRTLWARGDQDAQQRSALQILEQRFASGAIDREEFERRRAILTRR